MSMMRYQSIALELKKEFGQLPPGERLPGVRNLMMKYEASQATIDRSLAHLASQGVITRKAGRGYFIPEESEIRRRNVAFCFCYREERISNPLYNAMLSAFLKIADQRRYKLNVFACSEDEDAEKFRARFQQSGFDNCVILGCSKQIFLHILADLRIRTIQLYPNVFTENEPALLIDNHAIIDAILELFAAQGHKRIAMLHGQGFDKTYMFDQEERIEAFYRGLKRLGLTYSPRLVRYGGFDAETGYEAARQLLDTAPELRPTAVVANDYNAPGVYRACAELGLKIPEDLSVVGIDNLPQTACFMPPLTSVDIEWEAGLKAVADFLDGNAEEGGIFRTPVRLIGRESTAEAKNISEEVFENDRNECKI